jgi:hypothetical protein
MEEVIPYHIPNSVVGFGFGVSVGVGERISGALVQEGISVVEEDNRVFRFFLV